MDLDLKIENIKPKRKELFNFKNKKSQEEFKKITSNTLELSNCFKNVLPLSKQVNNWLQTLNSYARQAFKKIRIQPSKMKPIKKELAKLIDKRNSILKVNENNNILEALEYKIADK